MDIQQSTHTTVKKKRIMIYLITLGIILVLIVSIGFLTPKERITQRRKSYKISQKKIFEIVTDNHNFFWRSDLQNLIIIETQNDIETWKEIKTNGKMIIFKTTKKIPYSYYEFEIIKANGFTGYWTGEFKFINENETDFIATEHIIVKNPIIRLLFYLFVDIEDSMKQYEIDLDNYINRNNLKNYP